MDQMPATSLPTPSLSLPIKPAFDIRFGPVILALFSAFTPDGRLTRTSVYDITRPSNHEAHNREIVLLEAIEL